jgi:hypothetical protein
MKRLWEAICYWVHEIVSLFREADLIEDYIG